MARMLPICFTTHEFDALPIVRIIISGIIFFITIFIEVIAIKNFYKLKKLYKTLKFLFHLAVICTIIRCICIIFAGMVCVCDIITLFCYWVLLLSLLATLLVRLKYTFQHSSYAIPTYKLILFFILFIITSILFCISLVYYTLGNIERINGKEGISDYLLNTMIIGGIAISIYIGTGIWAVIEFSKNLLAICRAQSTSIQNMDKIKFNKSQKKLINQVSKYNALFSLAASTSIIFTICLAIGASLVASGIGGWETIAIMQCVSITDCIVNVVCLFLQYSFSAEYYGKYCECIDRCWNV